MSLDDWIRKEPKQFEYFHRLMGYIMLSLIILVYHYTSSETHYQIYVPIFLLFILLITPKLSNWLSYRFNLKTQNNVLFILDIVVIAIILSAIHLNLVLTLLLFFALLYTAFNIKISFMLISLASLLGCAIFYLCNIFIFGFGDYFEQTTGELTVLGFICLITYFGVGSFYQRSQVQHINDRKTYYFEQMNRYMEFANQLSRYAPMQLWHSIMKGESAAKIEYKRKKMTIFFRYSRFY